MIENTPIKITNEDISQANQLSLRCPICANAVEDNATATALKAVVCTKCGTLYHQACWEQSGNTCAILGCNHHQYRLYGPDLGPLLKITAADIALARPVPSANGLQKRLKSAERKRQRAQRPPPAWLAWFRRLLQAIKLVD